MAANIQKLHERVDKIEEQKSQELLTIIEILSNATFFGGIKKANCGQAKQGQCSFFTIKSAVEKSLPIVSECRIEDCKDDQLHYHIELSNITCSLCPNLGNKQPKRKKVFKLKRRQ